MRRLVVAVTLLTIVVACDGSPSDQFHAAITRDLTAYFQGATVTYDLLRKEPTQSGVAYPKYYAWVRAVSGGSAVEGAVRVANIDGERFEVTHFVTAADIRAHPQAIEAVFPAALCDEIRRRAGA